MSSETYWKEREAKNLAQNQLEEEEYSRRLNAIYQNQLDAIQKEIDSFYGKYADSEGITIAEAKKRVAKLDIEAYERKAARYVSEKNFSEKANREMRLYNATMKINRLELLKANIGLELIAGHEELDRFMEEILQGRTEDELKRQAGILGKTVQQNAKTASSIVNASFHHATFSDRIWMYQDLLKNELASTLQSGLIQGKNPRELARTIRQRFDVQTSNAERLMRTELARVQTDAQKRSFEENGFEEYEFIANGNCCSICDALDGKHFNLRDLMPGKNAPPMHPNCRCSTAAYEDSEEYDAWLDYLAKGGTTEEWKQSQESQKFFNERAMFLNASKRIGSNNVNLSYIKSETFRKKFYRLSDNSKVNDALRRYAEAMLVHRNGTDGEDVYIIDSKTGDLLLRKISSRNDLEVRVTEDELKNIQKKRKGELIGIHNHPTNIYPTGSDFAAAGYRHYRFGIVVTHDGRVFKYSTGKRAFLPSILDDRVDKYTKQPYNLDVGKAHEKALNELKEEYGISWEEIE